MSLLHRIDGEAPAEVEVIAPDRLLDGAPTTRTSLDYVRGDALFCGEWSASAGAWRVRYDEWEFCHMLEGVCELTPEGGMTETYKAGDSFVIEPGFEGVWRVVEPMRKRFVIHLRL